MILYIEQKHLQESQCCQLEQRVCELTRAQEALLVEKGETINHLSRSLEESQRQCQQLMSSTASQETIGLKLQLSTTRQEKDELSKKVHTLTVRNRKRNKRQKVRMMDEKERTLKTEEEEKEQWMKYFEIFNPEEERNESEGRKSRRREKRWGVENALKMKQGKQLVWTNKLELIRAAGEAVFYLNNFYSSITKANSPRTYLALSPGGLEISALSYHNASQRLLREYGQDATNLLSQLSKQEDLSKQIGNLSKENRNLCEQLGQSGSEISKLTTQLEDVRKEKEALEMENEQLKERIHELVGRLDDEKVSTIEQYNKEYFKFHDEALARVRQEKYEQAEAQVIDLR
uniref:Uncharacterized protein n=1 Tax=Timema genevievae TaxID=629358 RepID=A0A7R9PKX6_TIMGE|nr:unnamed protein product [Timema genevievae]